MAKTTPDTRPDSIPNAKTYALSDEFIQLFTKNQRRLFLFIVAQIGTPTEAEEVLQETNLVILNKADQFELGTNFFAWTCQIASYEVMKFRDRKKRDRHLFSDDFVQQIAAEAEQDSEQLELRRKALGDCLQKLRKKDRELIEHRYAPGSSGKDLADTLGRPANSVYQSLGRIRKTLLECIQRKLNAEAGL